MSESNATSLTYQVDFEPSGKRVAVAPGTTVLKAAQQAGLALAAACGSMGLCGQCRIEIRRGSVLPPTIDEAMLLTTSELQSGLRLACQIRVQSHLKVYVPPSSLITTQRLQLAGDFEEVTVEPRICAYDIEVLPPSLHDPRSDVERLAVAVPLEGDHAITTDLEVVRQITSLIRTYDWHVTVLLRDREIIGILPSGSLVGGIAVDLGSTKIAASLLDLTTGEELAVAGALNPQISYGEDVISRLAYVSRTPDGGHMLAGMLRETLETLLSELTEHADISREQVAEICLAGNTAMTHLFMELPVQQLAISPYVAATNAALDLKVRDLDLKAAPGAYMHVLPCIGGFVGADHVAMILASRLDHADQITLGIDIGTNTEIVLSKPGGLLTSVSCASGPAFEGAHISDGMRAVAGAIEAVKFGTNAIDLKTVDNAPPIGLCGSGIIDSVAELRRRGILNKRGRFQRQSPSVREGRHGAEFLLVSADHSGTQREIVITQKDINEIQLAKGAIRAGLEILLEVTDTKPEEVRDVIIAGAFGSFLNIRNAQDIGLFPHLPNARYRQVGNAALNGTKWALISHRARERARQIATQTQYFELSTYPQFSRRFALGMLFPDNGDAVPR